MRKIWVVLLLAPLLLVSTVAASPLYSPESLARYFRLDWQVVPGSMLPPHAGVKTDGAVERWTARHAQSRSAPGSPGRDERWGFGGHAEAPL